MYNLSLNDELVRRTRQSFSSEMAMTSWLQKQVEAIMVEYNTTQQIVRRNARSAIASMRLKSEQNGNNNLSLEDINSEIRQVRNERNKRV